MAKIEKSTEFCYTPYRDERGRFVKGPAGEVAAKPAPASDNQVPKTSTPEPEKQRPLVYSRQIKKKVIKLKRKPASAYQIDPRPATEFDGLKLYGKEISVELRRNQIAVTPNHSNARVIYDGPEGETAYNLVNTAKLRKSVRGITTGVAIVWLPDGISPELAKKWSPYVYENGVQYSRGQNFLNDTESLPIGNIYLYEKRASSKGKQFLLELRFVADKNSKLESNTYKIDLLSVLIGLSGGKGGAISFRVDPKRGLVFVYRNRILAGTASLHTYENRELRKRQYNEPSFGGLKRKPQLVSQ